MALILVRHAMPEVRPGVAAHLWALGGAGRDAAAALANALAGSLSGVVFTSPEPKARQTAGIIAAARGMAVCEMPGLAEAMRPETWDDWYRDAAARYLAGETLAGWEPREAVAARVAAAVVEARVTPERGDHVLVTHGLALSLYLASVTRLDLVEFWRALTLPDAWRFDQRTGSLEHVFRVADEA